PGRRKEVFLRHGHETMGTLVLGHSEHRHHAVMDRLGQGLPDRDQGLANAVDHDHVASASRRLSTSSRSPTCRRRPSPARGMAFWPKKAPFMLGWVTISTRVLSGSLGSGAVPVS